MPNDFYPRLRLVAPRQTDEAREQRRLARAVLAVAAAAVELLDCLDPDPDLEADDRDDATAGA